MIIRNNIGPDIDPCGTPQEISLSEKSTPLIAVYVFLQFKYFLNHKFEIP